MLSLTTLLVIGYLTILVQSGDVKYNYVYDRMEQTVNVNDFLKLSMDVEKTGDSTFKVKGQIAHTVTTEDMEVEMLSFHSDEVGGEMTETKFKGRKNICDFMKGPYKNVIYPKFKDTSNIPTPETCPLPAEEYKITETEVDVDRFKAFLKPGQWKIVMKLHQGADLISEVALYGSINEIP